MSSHIASEVYKAAIEEQNAGGPGYELLPSFRPHMIATPTDVSDFLVAMGWYTSLNPPELWNKSREPWAFNLQQNVLRWRALPLPMTFGEIADKKKVSYQRIQQLYHDGIDKVMRVANGHAAHDYLTSSPP
jgi:hypothetical protein